MYNLYVYFNKIGSNSNNDISILISRNMKYPLINPLLSLLIECLINEPDDQGY